MKKIVIDARFYGLENTGLGRYTCRLVDEIVKNKSEFEFYLLLRKKYFESLRVPNGVHKVLCDIKHYSISEHLFLARQIKKINPDLVHFLHFNVPINFNGNYIVTIHDLLMHNQKTVKSSTLPSVLFKTKRLGYHRVFRHAVLSAKKVIVPSVAVMEEVSKYYNLQKNKITAIYEGVEDPPMVPTGESVLKTYNIDRPYFIYTGNAYPYKNLDRAIEANYVLNKQYGLESLFVIVSARNVFIERLSKSIPVEQMEYVRLLGFVPDRDLYSLYKYSVGFVFPSFSEGFGLPGIDAMRAGTICLASDISVFKEIYKDNPFYFNPYDFTSIAESMRDVYTLDLKKRKEIILKSINFVKRYSWKKMSQKITEVYEQVLKI